MGRVASLDGLATVGILLQLMEAGVRCMERRFIVTKLRQVPARWEDDWLDPMLGGKRG